MTKLKLATAAIVMAAGVIVSCSEKKAEDPAALIVNGDTVTQSQVTEAAEFIKQQQKMISPESIFEASGDGRKGAARKIAANMLMIEHVKELGWVADSAVVEAMVERIFERVIGGVMSQFPDHDREFYMSQLAAIGMSEESIRRGVTEEVLLDSLLDMVSAAVDTASEEDIRAFYDRNQDSYIAPGRARASHIIFTMELSFDSAQIGETVEKAKAVLARAKAGEDFDELIKKYSSQPKYGDMGWFKKGDLIPDLEQVVFSMKKGGVSDLVPSGMGIHIIKKTDEEEPRPMPYEEARETIRKTLDFGKKGNRVNEFVDSLLLSADIKFIDKSLTFDLLSKPDD